jgi:hypothetical protein
VSHDLACLVSPRGVDLQPKAMRKPLETGFVCKHERGKSPLHVEWHQRLAIFEMTKTILLYAEPRCQRT